jgi:hypothetical protein
VSRTTKLEILSGRCAAIGVGHNVVELEQACLAASTRRPFKPAASTIAPPDRPPDCRRHMTGSSATRTAVPWPLGNGELLLFEISPPIESSSIVEPLSTLARRESLDIKKFCQELSEAEQQKF